MKTRSVLVALFFLFAQAQAQVTPVQFGPTDQTYISFATPDGALFSATTSSGTIVKSTNAGVNYTTSVVDGIGIIHPLNAQQAVAVGNAVRYSSDGMANFVVRSLPPFSGAILDDIIQHGNLTVVALWLPQGSALPATGWVISSDRTTSSALVTGQEFVLVSSDYGVTWRTDNVWSFPGRHPHLGSVGNDLYLYGDAIYRSSDGGNYWSSSLRNSGSVITGGVSMAFLSTDVFFAITSGNVYSTTDGGINWAEQPVPGTGNGIAVLENMVYATVQSGNQHMLYQLNNSVWNRVLVTSAPMLMATHGNHLWVLSGGWLYNYSGVSGGGGISLVAANLPALLYNGEVLDGTNNVILFDSSYLPIVANLDTVPLPSWMGLQRQSFNRSVGTSQFVFTGIVNAAPGAYLVVVRFEDSLKRFFNLKWHYSVVGPTGVDNSLVPPDFSLAQNYPNPFNPKTIISFSLPQAGYVTLRVYNLLGEEVAELVGGDTAAGVHEIEFNASSLPSGVYLYRLAAGGLRSYRFMLLAK